MTDDDRALDAEPIQHAAQHGGLIGRRIAAAASAPAPAKTGTVDQDDAVARRQPLAERKPHVFEIAAGAVNEDERRRAGVEYPSSTTC